MALVNFPNAAQTTLTGAGIGIGGLSMTVAAPAAFGAAPFYVRVEHATAGSPDGTQVEYMLVTAVAGSTFTVTKGQDGTADQAHAAGDFVTAVVSNAGLTTGLVRQLISANANLTLSPAGGQGAVTLTSIQNPTLTTPTISQVRAGGTSPTALTNINANVAAIVVSGFDLAHRIVFNVVTGTIAAGSRLFTVTLGTAFPTQLIPVGEGANAGALAWSAELVPTGLATYDVYNAGGLSVANGWALSAIVAGW